MKIGLFSDVHGHIEALVKTLKVFEILNVKELCFLGDSVGYFPGWSALELIAQQQNLSFALLGNHETMLLNGDIGHPLYRHQETMQMAEEKHKRTLRKWGRQTGAQKTIGHAMFVHGGPTDYVNQYIYPDDDLTDIPAPEGIELVICAHTHRPFKKTRQDGVTFVNIGSVGLPRDDGRFGCCALLDSTDHSVELIRFSIEAETDQALKRCAPVDQRLSDMFTRRADAIVGTILDV